MFSTNKGLREGVPEKWCRVSGKIGQNRFLFRAVSDRGMHTRHFSDSLIAFAERDEHRLRKAETTRLPQPGHGRAVLILDDDSVRSRSGGGVYPRHLGIYRNRSALAYRRHVRGYRRGHARVLLDKRAI